MSPIIWLRHGDKTLLDEHALSFGIRLRGGGDARSAVMCTKVVIIISLIVELFE